MKNLRFSTIILFCLIGLLSASTAYFYLQSKDKFTNQSPTSENTKRNDGKNVTANTNEKTDTAKNVESDKQPAATKPAVSTNRPSNPLEVYTVQEGETLFMIGQKLDMSWSTIAAINGVENADLVKAGDCLVIPTYDDKTKQLSVEYQVDTTRAAALQQQASSNPDLPYLDPVKVSQSDVPPIYGLTTQDSFTFESSNEYEGTAIVNAIHGEKKYQIMLIQPSTKGKGGIWAISKIMPAD